MTEKTRYILTLSCPDVKGAVAAVTAFLAEQEGFILESTQFGDASTCRFFMRVDFQAGAATQKRDALDAAFAEKVGAPFNMDYAIYDASQPLRTAILVSKQLHCLNDLLHRPTFYFTFQPTNDVQVKEGSPFKRI